MRKQDLDVQHPSPHHVSIDVVGPETQHNDRCCGIGAGWVLFIVGFFFPIAWYVGLWKLFCSQHDKLEKPGYRACAVAANLCTIIVILLCIFIPNSK